MVIFRKFTPSPELQPIVRGFEVLHMKWEDGESMPPPEITCLANTEQNLYFYPHDAVVTVSRDKGCMTQAPSSVVTGPKVQPVMLRFGKDYLMIKVQFYPTGLFRLLGIPMQKLINNGLDAREYLPDIEKLNAYLRTEIQYETMIAAITHYLTEKIKERLLPEEPIDQVAIEMLDPDSKNLLKDWASRACLSVRQFERSFSQRVGVSPKMYTRIVRFENVMRFKNANPGLSWSEIAMQHEYTDSSHLLREFRQFAEFPPGSLTRFQTSGHGDFPSG
ncbi:MAG: AraC family transcriptional regulator [Saprospiraceae bacterium]|nr:AraC family transcriptional regulator [Saprospiraceae bacterium]